jgi:hypothetical protein
VLAPSGASALDGNGVVAFEQGSDVWTLDPATGAQQDLTSSSGGGSGPLSWSPDGGLLLYTGRLPTGPSSFRGGPFVINADGTGAHPVVDDLSRFWTPVCWISPDLVVLRETTLDGQSGDYYVVHPDASGLRALTSDGGQQMSYGVCSLAAGRFFFTRYENGAPVSYSVSLDGGEPLRLPIDGVSPSPSPDGMSLAWFDGNGLFVSAIDGSDQVKVADPPIYGPVVWAPNSSAVAFARSGAYGGTVRSISLAGGPEHELTATPFSYDSAIAWSPDGTKSSSTRCFAAESSS